MDRPRTDHNTKDHHPSIYTYPFLVLLLALLLLLLSLSFYEDLQQFFVKTKIWANILHSGFRLGRRKVSQYEWLFTLIEELLVITEALEHTNTVNTM
jgi:hypothetical protein